MRTASEIGVFKLLFVWLVFVIGVATAQFKIIGVLDPTMDSDLIDTVSPLVKISSFEENQSELKQTPVQGRGLNSDQMDTLDDSENKTNSQMINANVITVRIMEDDSLHLRMDANNEPAIINNAIGINNGLEADDQLLQSNSAPLARPSTDFYLKSY